MAWTLVTPSSRGIGAALTRRLLQTTPASVPIVATVRSDVEGGREKLLADLNLDAKQSQRLDVQKCDVLSESSISDLAGYCKDKYNNKSKNKDAHLRLGLFVPGMLNPEKAPDKIDYDLALDTLKLSLLAPMILLKHFTSMLPRKSTKLQSIDGLPDMSVAAVMSARVGSISDNKLGGWYSYRASKSGVNQLVRSVDIFLKIQSSTNAISIALHPGTVKTDFSKQFWASTPKEKLFEPEFSAERLCEVIRNMDENKRGKCWDWQGKEVPP